MDGPNDVISGGGNPGDRPSRLRRLAATAVTRLRTTLLPSGRPPRRRTVAVAVVAVIACAAAAGAITTTATGGNPRVPRPTPSTSPASAVRTVANALAGRESSNTDLNKKLATLRALANSSDADAFQDAVGSLLRQESSWLRGAAENLQRTTASSADPDVAQLGMLAVGLLADEADNLKIAAGQLDGTKLPNIGDSGDILVQQHQVDAALAAVSRRLGVSPTNSQADPVILTVPDDDLAALETQFNSSVTGGASIVLTSDNGGLWVDPVTGATQTMPAKAGGPAGHSGRSVLVGNTVVTPTPKGVVEFRDGKPVRTLGAKGSDGAQSEVAGPGPGGDSVWVEAASVSRGGQIYYAMVLYGLGGQLRGGPFALPNPLLYTAPGVLAQVTVRASGSHVVIQTPMSSVCSNGVTPVRLTVWNPVTGTTSGPYGTGCQAAQIIDVRGDLLAWGVRTRPLPGSTPTPPIGHLTTKMIITNIDTGAAVSLGAGCLNGALSPNGAWLAVSCGGNITVYDTTTGTASSAPAPTTSIFGLASSAPLAWAPDSTGLFTSYLSSLVTLTSGLPRLVHIHVPIGRSPQMTIASHPLWLPQPLTDPLPQITVVGQ